MIELKPYFRQPEHFPFNSSGRVGMKPALAWENNFQHLGHKIALVGITDCRAVAGKGNICGESVGKIRQQLSQLFSTYADLVVDLGDLIEGKTIRDTYFALSQVVFTLKQKKIVPIIVGGSDAFIYGIYQSYKDLDEPIRHAHVDYRIDNFHDELDIITNENYLQQAKIKLGNTMSELSVIGYQTYYNPSPPFAVIDGTTVMNYRLGWLRQNLPETEPLFRNANLATIDMDSVRMSDNPANTLGMPNGLYAEEICQLAWYAGYADSVTAFGVFNYFSEFDNRNAGARLIAQLIWHFVEGYSQRPNELVDSVGDKYIHLHVNVESLRQELVFLKSNKTGRFWLLLKNAEIHEHKKIVPVSKQDYLNAVNNQISERIFFYLAQL
jgi:formiminoglutamase